MSEQDLNHKKRLRKLHQENEYQGMMQHRSRARSVTVGGCGNGMVEISMRSDFGNLWTILQPVEAVELLEQIAAACGVEVATRPKQTFSAWRQWEHDDEKTKMFKGTSPWEVMGQMHSVGVRDISMKLDLEREKRIKALEYERDMKELALAFAEETKMLESGEKKVEKISSKEQEDYHFSLGGAGGAGGVGGGEGILPPHTEKSKKPRKPRRPKQ